MAKASPSLLIQLILYNLKPLVLLWQSVETKWKIFYLTYDVN